MIFDFRFSIGPGARGRSLAVAVLVGSAFAGELTSGPTTSVRPNAFLVMDYLPPANYEGDNLSVCFRIENASDKKAEFEVLAKSVDADGKDMPAQTMKASAAANAFGAAKFEFETRRTGKIRFELKRAGVATALAQTNVVLLRQDDSWPATKLVNGRIVLASDNTFVVLLVEKKRKQEDRAFGPWRWLFGDGDDGGKGDGAAVVYAPASWRLNVGGIKGLGPWALDGSVPILNMVDRILTDVSAGTKAQRMVIVLPPEDLTLATDPRTYRLALDALLARLPKAGVVRTTLIAPYQYGCNTTHLNALWHEVHESAAVNGCTAIDPVDWSGEAQWRTDPSVPKVYGPIPNATGRRAVEQVVGTVMK